MSAAIDTRSDGAEVLGVDFAERVITVIAVPYEQVATVEYNGEMWREVFASGAFDGETNPERVRVCREHNRADTVGKVVSFDTRDPRGLVADIRIARTSRGDDTLGLAADRALSASVGFGVHRGGQTLDRGSRTRRVNRAWLDHIGLVMSPAYDGAQVVGVRSTPRLDRFVNDPVVQWARKRVGR